MANMPPELERYPWHGAVPRGASDKDLRALRELLAGYTEAGICARLQVPLRVSRDGQYVA
jgi:hypothetical protein